MKIPYKKKHQRLNLIGGIVWLVHFIFLMYSEGPSNYLNFIWLLLALGYFGIYFWDRREKFLTIEDGIIKQNWPFGKQVKLDEIKRIRYFAGDYTITTKNGEMKINTHLLDQDYFQILKEELEKTQKF